LTRTREGDTFINGASQLIVTFKIKDANFTNIGTVLGRETVSPVSKVLVKGTRSSLICRLLDDSVLLVLGHVVAIAFGPITISWLKGFDTRGSALGDLSRSTRACPSVTIFHSTVYTSTNLDLGDNEGKVGNSSSSIRDTVTRT